MRIHLYSTRSECVQLFRAMTSLYGSLNSSSAFGLSARLGWVHIRRLVGSTNQDYSSGFYFRIAWKSMDWPCFLQNHSLSFLWGLRSLKNRLLWKLSIKSLLLLNKVVTMYFMFVRTSEAPKEWQGNILSNDVPLIFMQFWSWISLIAWPHKTSSAHYIVQYLAGF